MADSVTDESVQIEDALFENLARPWLSTLLVVVIAAAHLSVAGIMWSRGRDLVTAVAMARGPRLLSRCGAMQGELVDQGQLWRLVSCIFLHGDGLHLLLNGVALWALGRICEAIYGPSRLLWLFLLSGVCGATFSWLGGNASSVGASGGVFGLLGASMVFGWRYRHRLTEPMSAFFRRKLAPWVVLNLVIGAIIPFIDNYGHVGGLVCGAILSMIMGNRIVPGEDSAWWVRGVLVLLSMSMIGVAVWGVLGNWRL